MRRRPLRNSLTLIVGQGVAQLASAVTFLVLARTLGVEQFGALATLYGASLFLGILIEFGATNHLIRELNRPGTRIFAGQYRSRLLGTVIIILILIALMVWIPLASNIFLCIALAFVLAHERYMTGPVRAHLAMGRLALVTALEKIAILAVTITASTIGALSETAFFLTCLATGVIACFVYRICWSRRYVAMVRDRRTKRFVNPVFGLRHLGLSSVAIGLQSLDAAAITFTAGPAAAGAYAAVGRWTQPLSLVTQAVTQTAYSEMVQAKRHREALASLRLHLGLLGIAAIPLVVVLILADELTLLLLGPEYESSAAVLRVLAGAVIFGVVNAPLSAFLQSRSDEVFTSKVLLTAMPLQLVLMCVFALFGGATFGALAVLVVQASLAFIFGLRARRLVRDEPTQERSPHLERIS